MKTIYYLVLVLVAVGCARNLDDAPRKSEYLLHRAGYEPVRGMVTFTELAPGQMKIEISLENTDPKHDFPAHLHFGTINEVGELAFRLEDVTGSTGRSVTILDQVQFPNGEVFTYENLLEMNGSVKIHLSDGLFAHVVLAYGNIGKNENYIMDGVTICTGH